jgi:hypothetical protein
MEQFPDQADKSGQNDPPAPPRESSSPSIVPSFPTVDDLEPTITIDARDLRIPDSQTRTFVGRIATRMVLGVVALSLFEAVVWIGQNHPSTGVSAEVTSPEPNVAMTAADSKPFEPSWFSPEIFSAIAVDPSPSAPPLADVPMPKPRPSPR